MKPPPVIGLLITIITIAITQTACSGGAISDLDTEVKYATFYYKSGADTARWHTTDRDRSRLSIRFNKNEKRLTFATATQKRDTFHLLSMENTMHMASNNPSKTISTNDTLHFKKHIGALQFLGRFEHRILSHSYTFLFYVNPYSYDVLKIMLPQGKERDPNETMATFYSHDDDNYIKKEQFLD
jgi:hypothetical protein